MPTRIAEFKVGFPKREGGLVVYIYNIVAFIFIKSKGLLKFAVVGGIGALLGFAMIYTLTEWAHFHYLISTVIACVSTTTVCYALNHFWTFRRAKIRHGWFAGWAKYEIADAMSNAIFLGEVALFTEVLGLWYMASAVLAVMINYPIRYALYRRYIWDLTSLEEGKTK